MGTDQLQELTRKVNDLVKIVGQVVDGVPLLTDIRQRLIHTEDKVNVLMSRTDSSEFHGCPDQRYGHLTYAQHGEDLVFAALFDRLGITAPSYLDVGANHPINCSNTALLYKRGSRGVNIDANPDAIALLNQMRPDDSNINVGVAGSPGSLRFFRIDSASPVNSFSEAAIQELLARSPWLKVMDVIEVPVLTLDQVVDTYCGGCYPDMLSVDAEGLDYDIIMAAEFRTKPKVLCVETLSPLGEKGRAMNDLLTSKGFRKCVQMHANGIYVDEGLDI